MTYWTTKIEVERDGITRLRVYHQNPDAMTAWTHPYDERDTCDICQNPR